MKKVPNPVDVHVGSRVRMRRILVGMSQEKLGELLGITFQQVQKYESGHYDIVPFTHTRNHEVLTNGLQLLAEITVSPSEGRA